MPQTTDVGPTGSQLAESVSKFGWDGNALEPGIALSMSGGSYRALLFHTGALMRLNELGLLSKVKRISSVSGGSIAPGHLAAVWNRLGRPMQEAFSENSSRCMLRPFSRSKGRISM